MRNDEIGLRGVRRSGLLLLLVASFKAAITALFTSPIEIIFQEELETRRQAVGCDASYESTESVLLLTYIALPPSFPSFSSSSQVYRNFRSSALTSGFSKPAIVTLRGPAWSPKGENNWLLRTEAYLNHVNSLAPDQPVLMTDAFDVLVSAPPSKVLLAYEAIGANIVFGAETLCDTQSCRRDPWTRERQRTRGGNEEGFVFLNAGTVMGTALHLAALLKHAMLFMVDQGGDDQAAYVNFWLSADNHASATLDYQSRLVAIISPQNNQDHFDLDESKNSPVRKLRRGVVQQPCMFHFASMKPRSAAALAEAWRSPFCASLPLTFSVCEEALAQTYNWVGGQLDMRRRPFRNTTSSKCAPDEDATREFAPIRGVFGSKPLRKSWRSALDGDTSKCNRVSRTPGRLRLVPGSRGVLRVSDYVAATSSSDDREAADRKATILWQETIDVPHGFEFPSPSHSLVLHLDNDGTLKVSCWSSSSSGMERTLWRSHDDARLPRNEHTGQFYAAIYGEEFVVVRGEPPLGASKGTLARALWEEDLRVNRDHRITWSSATANSRANTKHQTKRAGHFLPNASQLELTLRLRHQAGRHGDETKKKHRRLGLGHIAIMALQRAAI